MFIFMVIVTSFVFIGLLLMIYLTYKLTDMVFNLKLLFLWLFKYKLSTKEINFMNSFKSYSSFLAHYEVTLEDCDFFSIDKPNNVREGLEIVLELSSYN